MTNSFFNFTEAPDFASAIEQTYGSVNQSYDRREQLERENDATRLKNAGMPLEMIKAIAKFAPTAKKMADGLQKRAEDNALRKGYEDISEDIINNNKLALDNVFDFGKNTNFIKDESLKNKDNETYRLIDLGGEHQARLKWVELDNARQRINTGFDAFVIANYPQGFTTPADRRKAFSDYKTNTITNLVDVGFSERFVKSGLEDTFKELQKNFNTSENEKLTAQNVAAEQSRMINEVVNAFNTDNPQAAFQETSTYNIGFFGGNKAAADRAFLNIALMGAEKGVVNLDKLEDVTFGEITAKGDKRRILIDKLGGGVENSLWAEGYLAKIDEIRTKQLDNIDATKKDARRTFVNELDTYESENGRMEKAEYAAYVMSKWDIGRMGGNLPENIKNRLSKEGADDFLQKAILDGRLNKGLGITQQEVDKLQDSETRKTYSALVKTGNVNKPSKEFADIAEGFIKTYANTRTSETDGTKEKSERWNSIYTQAPKWYGIYYEEEIATASSAAQAHLNALKRVKDNIIAGDFDALPNVDEQSNLTRRVNLIKAERHIKTIDPNIINTGIIYGTEDIVKEAAKLPKGETHLFYQQLADKLPGVHADDLQFKQLELSHKKFGTDKPVKSDIQLALEKLPESVREKLTFHPSPARVARAKIEAYGSDNDITYNEIEFLLDEVSDFYTTPEGQAILDAQFPVEDEVVIAPDRNIVSAGNRTRQRPQGEVPFVETEQFKNVMSTLGSFLPELGFGGETRDALTQDIATAIEKRRKEVEKQNRKTRR